MADRIQMRDRKRTIAACTAFALLATCAWAPQTQAAGATIKAQVKRFEKHPDARLAWKLHEHFLNKGQLGKAMNWAERALASPKLTPTIQRKAINLRHSLRWDLRDAGYGMYKVTVTPVHAWLSIDSRKMIPRRSQYLLWLPEGSHALDLKAKDYADESRIIAASRGEAREMRVNMEMTRPPELRVEVQPINSEIWANRIFLGQASRRVFRLTPGPKVIEIRSPGYIRWVHTLSMKAGDRHVIKQTLKRIPKAGLNVRIASDVARNLTPLELANRGGRGSRLGQARTAGPARTGPPVTSKGAGADGSYAPPAGASLPSPTVAIEAVEDEGDEGDEYEGDEYEAEDEGEDEFGDAPPADAVVESSGGGGGGSSVFKGALWTGLGLALVGGGVGAAMVGVANAREANAMAVGHSRYDEFYDPAPQLALIGYGTAALGGATLVVGSLYLFGSNGLSRSAKGWTLTSLGLLAGGVGGYLMFDSVTQAEQANELKADSRNYTPNFDGAEQSYWSGVGAAGAGGLLTVVGLYVAFTKGSRGADSGGESLWDRVAVAPTLRPGQAGGVLHLRW